MNIGYYGFVLFVFILACIFAILCKYLFSDVKRQNKLLEEKEAKLLRLFQDLEEIMGEYYDTVEISRGEFDKELRKLYGEVENDLKEAVSALAVSQRKAARAPQDYYSEASPAQGAGFQKSPPADLRQSSEPQGSAFSNAAFPSAAFPKRSYQLPKELDFKKLLDEADAGTPAMPAAAPGTTAGMTPGERGPQQIPQSMQQVAQGMPQNISPSGQGESGNSKQHAGLTKNELVLKLSKQGKTRAQIAKELGVTQSEVALIVGLNKK